MTVTSSRTCASWTVPPGEPFAGAVRGEGNRITDVAAGVIDGRGATLRNARTMLNSG